MKSKCKTYVFFISSFSFDLFVTKLEVKRLIHHYLVYILILNIHEVVLDCWIDRWEQIVAVKSISTAIKSRQGS